MWVVVVGSLVILVVPSFLVALGEYYTLWGTEMQIRGTEDAKSTTGFDETINQFRLEPGGEPDRGMDQVSGVHRQFR